MRAQPKWHKKKVELKPLADGSWEVTHDKKTGNHPGKGPKSYPHVKLDQDEGPHIITFIIKGGQEGVTFSQEPGNAMWVKAWDKPKTKGDQHDQIVWRVDDEGTTLYAIDWNDNDAAKGNLELHYQLNFGRSHPALDPIIDNGGGIKPPATPPPPPPPAGRKARGNPRGRAG